MDSWFYPPVLAEDLRHADLPHEIKAEAPACGWEYIRCVVPEFTNWDRYIALVRIVAIGIIAEFCGPMIDVTTGDRALGYSLNELIDTLFDRTSVRQEMGLEYRSFLLLTAEKSAERRGSELFRRYVNALARSPRDWFRMRDCDALTRFTIAGALACNDLGDQWFAEEEVRILAELGLTLYDASAYYKHRAEGETHSTFAYVGEDLRNDCFRRCREVLWALDTVWARHPARRCVINFLRPFGGPIHMMMRRYRYVEDGLTIGNPETEHIVRQTRRNFKLWYRVDASEHSNPGPLYQDVMAQENKLLIPGLLDLLENSGTSPCANCRYRESYGAEASREFGGVALCEECRDSWQAYMKSLPARSEEILKLTSGGGARFRRAGPGLAQDRE